MSFFIIIELNYKGLGSPHVIDIVMIVLSLALLSDLVLFLKHADFMLTDFSFGIEE